MTPDRWRRIQSLFDAVADLPPAERDAVLSQEASGDDALRREVEALLQAQDEAEQFFDDLGGALTDAPLAPEVPPEAGPWRLVEKVGRGGMGEVWRAERADGVYTQTAAVKLVRPGLGDALLARFRAERQVLARLDHPGIARLLDGGTASDGRPYLAMEYVEGEPITAYADRQRLGIEDRLALFAQVCEAVAYAHRQLVVHRDIKPSNVLVASGAAQEAGARKEDGADARGESPHAASRIPHPSRAPRVKLLDFGIAKLLDDEPGFTLAQTGAEQRVLTPEYAAPEQVRGEAVTTATDVYGLGILLYELLTGTRPYRIESRVRQAIEQAILEQAPTEPSTAVTDARGPGEGGPGPASGVAEARATDLSRLKRRLRGDLDQIVLKALRKEPERRYDSASALAADVQRHLDGLPVEARPESAVYRASRFVKRHRVSVLAAGVVLLSILGGAGVAVWQAAEARAERDRAAAQATRAERTASILFDLFEGSAPAAARGDTLTARGLLDEAAARLAPRLGAQPETDAEVALVFARVYKSLALYDDAATWAARAVELYEQVEGKNGPRVAMALSEQGAILGSAQAPEAEVMALLDDAVRRARASGVDSALVIALNATTIYFSYASEGRPAKPYAEEALAIGARSRDVRPWLLIEPAQELGFTYYREDDLVTAESLYTHALTLARATHTGPHPDEAFALLALARILPRERAEPLAREAVRVARAAPRGTEPLEGRMLGFHAAILGDLGREQESLRLWRESVEAQQRDFGPEHPNMIWSLDGVAGMASRVGRHEEAIAASRRAVGISRSRVASTNAGRLSGEASLAAVLIEAGEYAEGERLVRDIAARQRQVGGEAWLPYLTALRARALVGLGQTALSERLLTPLLADTPPFAEKEVARAAIALYEATGRARLAEPFRAKAEA